MLRSANRGRGPTAPEEGEVTGPAFSRGRAAASLRLELLDTEEASDGRAAWRVADGLAAALVRTTATGEGPVDPDELLTLGLGREEAFHLASANVRSGALPTITRHTSSGTAELLFVSGPGPDVATHALWLDDLVGQLPVAGALVAVPHRRAILAHCLERWDHAVEAVNLLLLMADGAWRQGPDSVSPRLYWWRDGWFTDLAGFVDGDAVHIDPPREFVDVLDHLPRL